MAIRGCLLNRSTGFNGQNLTTATVISWDTQTFDPDGCLNSGSKIKIPAAYNGLRGIFTGMLALENMAGSGGEELRGRIIKNGSFAYLGASGAVRNTDGGNGQATTSHWAQWRTAPILLATNDEYQMEAKVTTDTSVDVTTASSFGLYVFGNAHISIKCLAQLNAQQTAKDFSSPAVINFDGMDIYDSHAIHDQTLTPSKLIVPAAADGKFGVVYATVQATSTTDDVAGSLAIRRTRSGTPSLTYAGFGGNSGINPSFQQVDLYAQTQVHQFTVGDEYETLAYMNDSSVTLQKYQDNTGTTPRTTMGMWVYG